MSNPASVIISTVGTSLLANLTPDIKEALQADDPARRGQAQRKAMTLLNELPPEKRGAEIDTLRLLLESAAVSPTADLFFCVSETPEGERIGALLQDYFQGAGHRVTVEPLAGLQDADPDEFRRRGLRSLVQTVGRIVREHGGPDHVCLNATGGYKAQIALAALMGQALGVTVYYKHERFPSIIAMPPMPIAFDYELLGQEAPLFAALEDPNATWPLPPGYHVDERLLPLLDIETVDGIRCASLTPVGQTFLEGFRLRYPPEKTLPPDAEAAARKGVHLGDHGYTPGFAAYVRRVYDNAPYARSVQSREYRGKGTLPGFRIASTSQEILGVYDSDKGETFALETTARTQEERLAVVADLNRRFRGR